MDKLLSIIIPTYNAEKFLDKGLTSFIMDDQEKMDRLEVLVINDGTPDNSVAVAQKYVDLYPATFQIISKENGGHGSAINTGVEHATGQYMKCVDADDWVDTEVLSHLMDILKEHSVENELDALIMSYRTYHIQNDEYEAKDVSIDGGAKGQFMGPYTMVDVMNHWDELYWGLSFHGLIYNTGFYRRLKYRLLEHVFYEDQEYATIPMSFAKKIGVIDEELYVYRIGDVNQSISCASSLKRLDHFEAVILRMGEMNHHLQQITASGREYWKTKASKFINDYYQLCLIRNPDKKQCRKRLEEFNKKLEKECPMLYKNTQKNYRVFRMMNQMHMSEKMYQEQFMPLLHSIRKLR